MLKTAIATAILGLGVLGAYFVIQNTDINAELAPKNDSANLPKNSPFVENLANGVISEKTTGSAESNKIIGENNLTDDFINGLKQDIAQNNFDNTSSNLVVSDPNQITGELLNDAVKKFGAERLKPLIDESRIKVSHDNSQKAIENYINKFQEVIMSSAKEASLDKFNENSDPGDLSFLIPVYEKAIELYYKLPVPSSALAIHKKQMILLAEKLRAIRKISNYKDDPLSAILAAEEIKKIDQAFSDLSLKFGEFAVNQ